MKLDNILGAVYETPWLITQPALETISSIVERKINGENFTQEQLASMFGDAEPRKPLELPTKPSVGIIPIQGSIFPKANLMTSMSGATSVENLRADFKQMMESDMVTHIILHIDSPGGAVSMIQEFGNDIFESRGKKPIIAVADGMMASAAYWLGTQADKIYATPSAQIGSIGVIGIHKENSKQQENAGIKTTVITAGEYKGLGNPHEPLTDADRSILEESMIETYTEFVDAVARGRGVTADLVLDTYGKGLVYKSKRALGKGMIDEVKTFEDVVSHYANQTVSTGVVAKTEHGGNKMEVLTPETLEALGLSEDATSEEIQEAVLALSAKVAPLDALKNAVSSQQKFAEMFPEQAAEMAELKENNLKAAATLFSESYAKFTREGKEFGFSALVISELASFHLELAKGTATTAEFKTIVDRLASDDAIVPLGEIGSKRASDAPDTTDMKAVMAEFAAKISEVQKRDSLDYESAMEVAANENPELATAYAQSYASGRK